MSACMYLVKAWALKALPHPLTTVAFYCLTLTFAPPRPLPDPLCFRPRTLSSGRDGVPQVNLIQEIQVLCTSKFAHASLDRRASPANPVRTSVFVGATARTKSSRFGSPRLRTHVVVQGRQRAARIHHRPHWLPQRRSLWIRPPKRPRVAVLSIRKALASQRLARPASICTRAPATSQY